MYEYGVSTYCHQEPTDLIPMEAGKQRKTDPLLIYFVTWRQVGRDQSEYPFTELRTALKPATRVEHTQIVSLRPKGAIGWANS